MKIEEFICIAKQQDKSNVFQEYTGSVEHVPNEFKDFYRKYNPVDVEVTIHGNAIKFFRVEELFIIQKEYEMDDKKFVFASCNGDPIFCYGTEIFTRYHGSKKSKDEKIASSFIDYLSMIDNAY